MKIISRIKFTSAYWLIISVVLVVSSMASIGWFGFNWGIDFTGGSLLEVSVKEASVDGLRQVALDSGYEAVVQPGEGDLYFVRLQTLSEDEHQSLKSAILKAYPNAVETRFDSVGPTIGAELRRSAVTAFVILVVLIGVYIAWAFRHVSEPIASYKYGLITMISAVHDVVIPLGVFAALGHYFGYQIDTAFVAAILTILGYSINDTIVVLDRTRENLHRYRYANQTFPELVNKSVAETLGRSINTTLTTLLPLLAIFFVGGETTKPFVLALIIGIASGAYSSIFVASPLLIMAEKIRRK